MADVKRIYPESKTGLINWIEQNFHDIDEFVVQFQLKDGTPMMIYDVYSYRNAVGMLGMATDSVHAMSREDRLKVKNYEE